MTKSRLKPPVMGNDLEERWRRSMPPGTKVTPPQDLQLQNFPEEDREHKYPRWDEMIRYWDEVPE